MVAEDLFQLVRELKSSSDKLATLRPFLRIEDKAFCQALPSDQQCIFLSMSALGELERFRGHFAKKEFAELLESLVATEEFYKDIGGLVGYHAMVLRLMAEEKTPGHASLEHAPPPAVNLTRETKYVLVGIEALPQLAFIFPVGGAGDRLNLHDEASGEPLPAAKLQFGEKTLLELLFEHVQSLEYLYFKITGEQLQIPVALMTSQEKNNDKHILNICDHHEWFHRNMETLLFCTQPLSPVITVEGKWAYKEPFQLHMKPGGHGVIWKLAIETGIFERLKKRGVEKALVRQINNPSASLDHTLLTLAGVASGEDKAFGFVTCERPVGVAEGAVVLRADGEKQTLTNIEYVDFVRAGIEDAPREEGSRYSQFPANTNILAVDLAAVEEVAASHPLPGLLVNPKSSFETCDFTGKKRSVKGGRLETTMQNIADYMGSEKGESLRSFACYGPRSKTLATTKQLLRSGKGAEQSVEKAFYDRLSCWHALLHEECGFQLEPLSPFETFVEKGPNYLFDLHDSLGPLYSIIRQKIRGGKIAPGSELKFWLAELDIENLHLQGALSVVARRPMGKVNEQGQLLYGESVGRCTLKNVHIANQGVNRESALCYWQANYAHVEQCRIILRGSGEFYAEGVSLTGSQTFEVPSGKRLVITPEGKRIEEISRPTWRWEYLKGTTQTVVLNRASTL